MTRRNMSCDLYVALTASHCPLSSVLTTALGALCAPVQYNREFVASVSFHVFICGSIVMRVVRQHFNFRVRSLSLFAQSNASTTRLTNHPRQLTAR